MKYNPPMSQADILLRQLEVLALAIFAFRLGYTSGLKNGKERAEKQQKENEKRVTK
jgi:hypothetical protein